MIRHKHIREDEFGSYCVETRQTWLNDNDSDGVFCVYMHCFDERWPLDFKSGDFTRKDEALKMHKTLVKILKQALKNGTNWMSYFGQDSLLQVHKEFEALAQMGLKPPPDSSESAAP